MPEPEVEPEPEAEPEPEPEVEPEVEPEPVAEPEPERSPIIEHKVIAAVAVAAAVNNKEDSEEEFKPEPESDEEEVKPDEGKKPLSASAKYAKSVYGPPIGHPISGQDYYAFLVLSFAFINPTKSTTHIMIEL